MNKLGETQSLNKRLLPVVKPPNLQALAPGHDVLLQCGPLGDEGSSYDPDVNVELEL